MKNINRKKGYFINFFFVIFFIFLPYSVFGSDDQIRQNIYHIETRVGTGMVCGSCRLLSNNDDFSSFGSKQLFQVFGDKLFTFKNHFAMGPYFKASAIENTPQFGGGILFEYSFKKISYLSHVGLSYSTERLGDINDTYLGQTKETYDLSVFSRISLRKNYYISFGIGHNSNGQNIGLNFFRGKGNNPGFDYLFLGTGKKF